jgi:hypothetical protein
VSMAYWMSPVYFGGGRCTVPPPPIDYLDVPGFISIVNE